MSLSATLVQQFDFIIEKTRLHLASIPDDRLDWKPHEKSYSIGELGSHIANLPQWVMATIGMDEFDISPVDGPPPPQPQYGSSAQIVAALDENAGAAREMIAATSDEGLMRTWTMLVAGEEKFSLPKIAVLRTFVLDHLIHHRAQLTVYLRMLDVPVQQTFGPTADFPDM